MKRRAVLAGTVATVGLGGYLYSKDESRSCDVACFEFFHEGFDDAPDWLTVRHTQGRALPADEVFVTNVVVDHGPETDWITETVAWHDVDEATDPTDDVDGSSVRVDIGSPDIVRILWRRGDDERVLDETRSFR